MSLEATYIIQETFIIRIIVIISLVLRCLLGERLLEKLEEEIVEFHDL